MIIFIFLTVKSYTVRPNVMVPPYQVWVFDLYLSKMRPQ